MGGTLARGGLCTSRQLAHGPGTYMTPTQASQLEHRQEASDSWTGFVARTGLVRPGWWPQWERVFRDGLGYQMYRLEERDQAGHLKGVLLLARVRSWLFGDFLVSLPYLNYGGIHSDDSETSRRLLDRAIELADELDVDHLCLRHEAPLEDKRLEHSRTDKVIMRLDLPDTVDELWKQVGPKVRNQVRKAKKCKLTVHWGREDLLPDFYRVFARNMRDLGTPVYGKRLFRAMLRHLGERCEICVVRGPDSVPYAASVLVHGIGVSEVPSASSIREYNSTCANMLLYWSMLCRTIERGHHQFDFGRSTVDSNTYKFKKQWGAKPHPSCWQYSVRRGDPTSLRPDDPKYRKRVQRWKRLPLWLANLLGPHIVRGIP